MTNKKKPKPMPGIFFKFMTWGFKLTDLIRSPQQRVAKMPVKKGMTVVDYGCGPGRYTLPIAKLVGPKGKVLAVDIQPLAIKMVKEKAARELLANIEPILIDSYNTGVQGSSIDLVILLDTLHMVKDRQALFQEMHRILKQDGLLFLGTEHMRMARVRKIVEGSGLFAIAECRGHDMLVVPEAKK
ncbi:MAG: class I SAM-dependent methyltransferase [Dehalococcoidia bacterium]|nr:MAG: class I SAM-dependent methyltransferase [Dehalococcoidia bacterium]